MTLTLLMLMAAAPAENAAARLAKEQRAMREELLARCPEQKDSIVALETAAAAQRLELLLQLAPCGETSELFLVQLGNAQNLAGKFPEAEATFGRALAKRVTESATVGKLTAISRQKARGEAQKKELKAGLDYFRASPCTRDDLCAGLSYVAWHEDDVALAKSSAERAISLGYPGWQPYFTGGTAYATGAAADRKRAVELLNEAKKRGGPTEAIDGFLSKLKAP